MATFRNRHGKWQARVQRKGQQPVSKSFQSKEDAQRFQLGVILMSYQETGVLKNMIAEISCRLCGNLAHFSFQKKIISKHDINYFHCQTCGALQTEEPYWLDEAYQPINEQLDTGQFIRCLHNAAFLDAVTSQLNLSNEPLIDYGCGSGLTARILRDVGINAYGYDTYSTPRLLMGFQTETLEGASIINLCEVAEHFHNPKSSFEHIFSCKPKNCNCSNGNI
jgi:hypothetical protein